MIFDYHVHLERGPYQRWWLDRFVHRAEGRGLAEIGFSEHMYRFKQAAGLLGNPWENRRRTQDLGRYLDLLQHARSEGLPIKIGIEFDYVPRLEDEIGRFLDRYPFDYRLGSVHWLGDFGFDLDDSLTCWKTLDLLAIYNKYFDTLVQLARSGLADVIAHPDVIKVFGYQPTGPGAAAFLDEQYARAAEAIAANDLVAEVSTAGLRKPVGRMYPEPRFLKALRARSAPIVISSDAHRPLDVAADFDRAVEYARAAGYDEVVAFAGRRRSPHPLGR